MDSFSLSRLQPLLIRQSWIHVFADHRSIVLNDQRLEEGDHTLQMLKEFSLEIQFL